jgi:hypothetical protein
LIRGQVETGSPPRQPLQNAESLAAAKDHSVFERFRKAAPVAGIAVVGFEVFSIKRSTLGSQGQ